MRAVFLHWTHGTPGPGTPPAAPQWVDQHPLRGHTVRTWLRRTAVSAGVLIHETSADTPYANHDLPWLSASAAMLSAEDLAWLVEAPRGRLMQGQALVGGYGLHANTDVGPIRRLQGVAATPMDTAAHWHQAQEALLQAHRLALLASGVRFPDGLNSVRLDAEVTVMAGASLGHNVVLRGHTTIGEGAEVRAGCWLTDTTAGPYALLRAHSVCESADIGARVTVGPMAHLRPGTVLEADARIGNFVETKNTRLRQGAKANHLTYLGDADVGERANIGAGTITCNYDGAAKHRTHIGADAFVGTNSALVAPVRLGDRSLVGAGTVVVTDVPDEALATARPPQRTLDSAGLSILNRNRDRAGKPPLTSPDATDPTP